MNQRKETGQEKKIPVSVHVGFVVDKLSLGQVLPRVFRFSPVNFIPPVLNYLKNNEKKLTITGIAQ